MPHAVIALPWFLALPWLLGLLFAYILKVDRQQKVYTGFYNDTLVRTPDGWRFKTKEEWHDTEPDSPYRATR